MPDAWPDDADENMVLMRSFDGAEQPQDPFPPPPRRKRAFSTYLLALLVSIAFLILLLLSGIPSRSHPLPPTHQQDSFELDPSFDNLAPPRTRVYRWTVSSVTNANRMRVVVNGRSPGPLIQANAHDRILVYVTNALDSEGTAIHWHGLPLPDTPFYDGTPGISQCPIPPGATLLYNFTFGGWTGTTWWHGHTGVQHTDGLFGPLIVHPSSPPASESDHILTVADGYRTPVKDLLTDYLTANPIETVPEPVPDFAQINGRGEGPHPPEDPSGQNNRSEPRYFEVRVSNGSTPTLRLINAGSFAPLRISVDAHALVLLEADGSPLTPVRVRDFVVQPGQRYHARVERVASAEGEEFWIRARMVEDGFADDNLRMEPEARAILRYSASSALPTTRAGSVPDTDRVWWDSLDGFDEWALRPAVSVPVSDAALTLPFTFSIQRTSDLNWRTFVNATSWEMPKAGEAALVADVAGVLSSGGKEGKVHVWPGDQLIAALPHNYTVDVVITNLDDGDHPFHLHGYSPWLLGHGRGRFKPANNPLNTVNPLRRDTFTVPARSWAVVRLLTDNPGYWAFHCHISWHMAGGGLFQLAVPPADGQNILLPSDIVEHCKMWDR
ncbi:multicopper oxidase-domain-containing protein [Mycena amicta]|nr:multicopper oxidase-domain-containing protein [Mycena amicta]